MTSVNRLPVLLLSTLVACCSLVTAQFYGSGLGGGLSGYGQFSGYGGHRGVPGGWMNPAAFGMQQNAYRRSGGGQFGGGYGGYTGFGGAGFGQAAFNPYGGGYGGGFSGGYGGGYPGLGGAGIRRSYGGQNMYAPRYGGGLNYAASGMSPSFSQYPTPYSTGIDLSGIAPSPSR